MHKVASGSQEEMEELEDNMFNKDSITISDPIENTGVSLAAKGLPADLPSLRAEMIRLGANPRHKQFVAKEEAVLEQANRKVEAELRRREALRPKWAKFLSNFVSQALSVISIVFVIVVVLLGVLGVSGLMVVAEIHVVHDGIASVTETNSWLYAHALVLLYLVMLFVREIISSQDETKPTRELFSLQHLSNWFRYFIGGKNWKPRVKNEYLLDGANLTIKWLMMSVLLFGVLGRLAMKLDTFTGSWHEALKHIVTSSTLPEMLGYISSIGISVGLMLGAHFITNFVFREYRKLTGSGVNTQDFFADFSPSVLIEREVVLLYQDEILRLQAKNQQSQQSPQLQTVAS